MYRFKVYSNTSIRRFLLENENFDDFIHQIHKCGYKKRQHRLEYQDDEDEWVTLKSEKDWSEALNVFDSIGTDKTIRIRILPIEETSQSSPKRSNNANNSNNFNFGAKGEEFLNKFLSGSGNVFNDIANNIQEILTSPQVQETFSKISDKKDKCQEFIRQQYYPHSNPHHHHHPHHSHPHHPHHPHSHPHHPNFHKIFHPFSNLIDLNTVKQYICDACNILIEGDRYRCLACSDYDLCKKCIDLDHKEHKNYMHYPSQTIWTREDKDNSISDYANKSQESLKKIIDSLLEKKDSEKKSSSPVQVPVEVKEQSQPLEVSIEVPDDDEYYNEVQENEYYDENQVELPSYQEIGNHSDSIDELEIPSVVPVASETSEASEIPEVVIPSVSSPVEIEVNPKLVDPRLKHEVELLQSMGFNNDVDVLIQYIEKSNHDLRAVVEKLLDF